MWRDTDRAPDPRDPERPGANHGGARRETPDLANREPSDVFTRALDLPRGDARERVYARERAYDLRGSEARLLASVGAFRVVPQRDLPGAGDADRRAQDVRHLRDLGLIEARPFVVGDTRTTLLTLTASGRDVLEHARRPRDDARPDQAFYAGIAKPRELAHDAQLYRAYARAAERIAARGGHVRRVVLEEELKRQYQRFLQEPNRRRRDSDGRPGRSAAEVAAWAHAHAVPLDEGRVQFPDVRLEYDERDGRRAVEDLEVTTPHYRGAHAAAKARSGFTRFRAAGPRVGGLSGRSRGGGPGFSPRVAEEVLE